MDLDDHSLVIPADLKWLLWSRDETEWQECVGDVDLAAMKASFFGDRHPVMVESSPSKATRHAMVRIGHGVMAYMFWCEWDHPVQLAEVYDTASERQKDDLAEAIVHWESDNVETPNWLLGPLDCEGFVPAILSGWVRDPDFAIAMAQVDAVEDLLIKMETTNSRRLDAFVEQWVADDNKGVPTDERARRVRAR